MTRAYYNERDEFAAAWLRELVKAGLIAPGDVDERDILDVVPVDLKGYAQCHFFAGIGVWSYAMRSAGWPDDRAAWSGSCPCQPFSQAGEGLGFADERHLWPAFFHLIRECRPDVIFGEQVASPDGLGWLDLVSSDMEAEGYAFGALDTCAAGFGAPHIRQRLYWMADSNGGRHQGLQRARAAGIDSDGQNRGPLARFELGDTISWLGEPAGSGRERFRYQPAHGEPMQANAYVGHNSGTGPTNDFWRAADWLRCRDDKWRAVEPGTFPLANGAANRVGRLRGYGNAIVAPQAEAFIRAALAYAP